MQSETHASDQELLVLEKIHSYTDRVRQRDLAQVFGISLGMANTIVKRLVSKGWLTIRKVNNRNVRYAVSPRGIEQISRRSYRYFKQTVKNIVCFKKDIEIFVRSVGAQGYNGILLIGKSELDFIVQHACRICGMAFQHEPSPKTAESRMNLRFFKLYSESYGSGRQNGPSVDDAAYLHDKLISTVRSET
jgi:DNA-binding MarR family transcriptional regulator